MESVKLLLEWGADITIRNKDGHSAIDVAILLANKDGKYPTKSISRNTTTKILEIDYRPGKYFINQNQPLIYVKKTRKKNHNTGNFVSAIV